MGRSTWNLEFRVRRYTTWECRFADSLKAISSTDMPPLPTPPKLRLASWNLEHLTAVAELGPRPRRPDGWAHLTRIAQDINPHIWLLQEIDDAEAAHRILPRERWHVLIAPRREHDALKEVALRVAIAVRTELTDTIIESRALSLTPWWVRWLGGRPALELRIEWASGVLRVLCVHLKAGCWTEDAKTRTIPCLLLRWQFKTLARWLVGEDDWRIVGGDLNRALRLPEDTIASELAHRKIDIVEDSEDRTGDWREPIDHWLAGPSTKDLHSAGTRRHAMPPHDENPDHFPVSIEIWRR